MAASCVQIHTIMERIALPCSSVLAERRRVAVLEVLLPAEPALEVALHLGHGGLGRVRGDVSARVDAAGVVGVLQLVADGGKLLLLLQT